MSFNFLEVQKAIQELTEKGCVTGAVVKRVSLVNFALPRPVVDLNLGFELELRDGTSKWLVFCLKNPYTGVFLADPARIRPLHPSEWGKAFHGSQPWGELIVGGKIESISVVHNERIVEIDFFKKVKLTLELFPARPNWILEFEGTTLSWRQGRELPASKNLKTFSVREFSEFRGESWLDRALVAYLDKRAEFLFVTLLASAKSVLEEKMARFIRLRAELGKKMSEGKLALSLKEKGDAILANLHEFPRAHKSAKIAVQWLDKDLSIALDEELTLSENAERFYQKYKKQLRAMKEVEPRAAEVDKSLSIHRAAAMEVARFRKLNEESFWQSIDRLLKLFKEKIGFDLKYASEGIEQKKNISKAEKKIAEKGLKRFSSKEGMQVLVGRNHEENEEIVMRIAKGNDLWFHLKGVASAHAIVQVPKKKTASLETMLDAATLVLHYSSITAGQKKDVDYTFRKNVKRVAGKGQGKFLVTYQQNKTLTVALDPARLSRLLSNQA